VSALGRPRVHLRSTGSTSDHARRLALGGAPDGTLVTASVQTAGRGRQGRRWTAPADSALLMSVILHSPPSLLPLIAAVAVCDVVGADAHIKWPNDIVLARAGGLYKLAGILAEGRPQEGWAILGIGLNVAVRIADLPAELREQTATLGESSEEIEPTLQRLLGALGRRLAEDEGATLEAWRARDVLRGREITWGAEDSTGARRRGRAEGIDGTGRLRVALADGAYTALDSGEVHLHGIS
jgi:BirA family transcriptional regulator, biotin operon repressor / biotin---[acetyl-CoA-carboxylase] ligase